MTGWEDSKQPRSRGRASRSRLGSFLLAGTASRKLQRTDAEESEELTESLYLDEAYRRKRIGTGRPRRIHLSLIITE